MKRLPVALLLAAGLSACASMPIIGHKKTPSEDLPPKPPKEVAVASPNLVKPAPGASTEVYAAAQKQKGMKIVISRQARSLWLMRDTMLLFRAPVAIGRSKPLIYKGKQYDFTTPVGKRKVIGKGTSPLWTPPDWHYFEIALDENVEPYFLKMNSKVMLGDSTWIQVRNAQVGRINRFGNWWPFTPGKEIIFDNRVFVPPVGTPQRQIPEILGTHKLEMGNGYLIHGTNEEGSIGDAVSHGCVRMYNEDVAHLYDLVPIGTPIYIF